MDMPTRTQCQVAIEIIATALDMPSEVLADKIAASPLEIPKPTADPRQMCLF
jgi:hypothetical protein